MGGQVGGAASPPGSCRCPRSPARARTPRSPFHRRCASDARGRPRPATHTCLSSVLRRGTEERVRHMEVKPRGGNGIQIVSDFTKEITLLNLKKITYLMIRFEESELLFADFLTRE